jgi:isopenicillin N synthase-like dioxygenase
VVVAALPVIDVAPLLDGGGDAEAVARAIDAACREVGFFRIIGHGIELEQLAELDRLARAFFARPDHEKAAIAMERGGPAWRGWFPLDGELTSGVPDHKEGIYFGTELGLEHPAVRAGRPLHGANLFPDDPAGLRPAVLRWMEDMTRLGTVLLGAIAVGLGLDADWFERSVTAEPTVLFRIFRYPPRMPQGWGVAEHTDYGLLTILATDDRDGLQVRGPDGWLDVPADPSVFIVNLGDMLERMTQGRYRSTPHRVRNRSDGGRLSFPCFIDPSWDAVCPVLPLDGAPPADDPERRWDGTSVRGWDGTYGDYLTAKVARVFPALFERVGRPADAR